MSLPFVCCQFFLVDVVWSRLVAEPTPIERMVSDLSPGDRVERTYRAIWPDERFTRDDIDDVDVQRGFVSMRVSPVTRQFFRTDSTTLMLHKGRMRVCVPGHEHDPYFIGFAPDLSTAATWVYRAGAGLVVPWEATA